MRLPEAVQQLSNFIDEDYAKTKTDMRNADGELVQYSLICNSKSFQIVNDEFRQVGKSPFTITEGKDSYKVKGTSSAEYSATKAQNECTCLCFANFGLPCRHISF